MIEKVAKKIKEKHNEIEKWLKAKTKNIPVYSSFDIRNSGHKAVVVDSNAFPAGFNNLCSKTCDIASENIKFYIENQFEKVKTVGLIAEYTKNSYYYDNIITIKRILENAGFQTETGIFDLSDAATISSFSKGELKLKVIKKRDQKLVFDSFTPDLILLNDDFSTTDHAWLEGCRQYIAPTVELGWFKRKKHRHFAIKNRLIKELSDLIGIDRCFIGAYFEFVSEVNFKTREKFDEIAAKIDSVIYQIQKKYDEYNITEKPFVFVKGDSSTYGMNAIPFHSGSEFLKINSKERTKLYKSKGGKIVTEVMIQEGVRSIDRINGNVAEPVIYCVGDAPVGGFFRINPMRSDKENLNSKGMSFSHSILCPGSTDKKIPKSNITEEKTELYRFLARLGAITIGYEMEELK